MRSTRVNPTADPAAPQDASPALERARRAGRGDQAELTSIYETRRGEVLGFLVGMTHDREVAEDLLQEVFVRLVRESREGRMPDDVRPWLYRVAANLVVSRGRRATTWLRLVPRLLDRREPPSPEGEVLRSERDRELGASLARLKPDGRAALLLAAQGFSGHEIAASLGRSDAATRTMMCRARQQLRQTLEAPEGRP